MKSYDMTDGATRRKVFWLLKRLTSYSLWERKRDAWEHFTRAYENAVKTWPKSQPEQVEADNLAYIYNILSLYDKGLTELSKGKRYVWRADQPLYQACLNSAMMRADLYRHPAYWERGIQLEPWPPKIEELHQLLVKSFYQDDGIPLEVLPQQVAPTARLSWANSLLDPVSYKKEFYELPYPVFPSHVPELPEATNIVITSGEKVPTDGIWEPVHDQRSRLFGIIRVGEKVYENEGCFNYFVKDTIAPKVDSYNESADRTEYVNTHWRLLWEDARYKDETIPDESGYFLEPEAERKLATIDPGDIEVKTGEVCPANGLWAPRGYDRVPIRVEAGAVMPDLLVPDSLGEPQVRWVTWHLVKAD